MSFFFTAYYLAKNTINELEPKYKEQIDLETSRLFLYANAYQIPELFRFTKIKSFEYDLYTKLTNYKQDMFIKNMVKETISNKYYPNNILLLYSITTSIILYEELKLTNLKKGDYSKFDYNFAKEKGVDITGKKMYKKFRNCVLLSFTELDFLKETMNLTYHLPKVDVYISEAMKVFKRCLNPNPLFKVHAFFMDHTFYHKHDTKFSYFISKNKYEQKENATITYNDEEILFSEFIKIVSEKSLFFLNAINDALYLDKLSTLVEYSKLYNWNSITEYYNFINKQKEDELERTKQFDKLHKQKRDNKKKASSFFFFKKKDKPSDESDEN